MLIRQSTKNHAVLNVQSVSKSLQFTFLRARQGRQVKTNVLSNRSETLTKGRHQDEDHSMNIAFAPEFDKAEGGVFQYSQTMLRGLKVLLRTEAIDELHCLAHNPWEEGARTLASEGLNIISLEDAGPVGRFRNIARRTLSRSPRLMEKARALRRRSQQEPQWENKGISHKHVVKDRLTRLGVRHTIFPKPTPLGFEIGLPYAMAIHDLQHRLQEGRFPELMVNNQFQQREYIYRNAVKTAQVLLVDSEIGKEDVLEAYGQDGARPEQIAILPFHVPPPMHNEMPAHVKKRIKAELGLPEKFVFYPAQYWQHKNHVRIIEALQLLHHQSGLKLPVFFCGSYAHPLRQEVYRQIEERTKTFGLEECVHHLGYVSDDVLRVLYHFATALVMPTYFGPTNIPVVEAWHAGCPVITSNIRGIREHIGDAGLLAHPDSAEELAAALQQILENTDTRDKIVDAGRKKIETYGMSEYLTQLKDVLTHFDDT